MNSRSLPIVFFFQQRTLVQLCGSVIFDGNRPKWSTVHNYRILNVEYRSPGENDEAYKIENYIQPKEESINNTPYPLQSSKIPTHLEYIFYPKRVNNARSYLSYLTAWSLDSDSQYGTQPPPE